MLLSCWLVEQEVGAGFDAYLSTIFIGIVRMLVGLLTTILLRRFGRRPLFVFSGLGMAISMGVSGYFTRLIAIGKKLNLYSSSK